MTRESVTVVIPVRDDAQRLAMALDALERQTYPSSHFEVVVVDNGSATPPETVVASSARVRFFSESRPGSYAARNRAFQAATGDIIAFTDADCLPDPHWLERGVACLIDSDAGLVGGRIDVIVGPRPTTPELHELKFAFRQRDYIESRSYAATANAFTWRRVLDEVGPFDDTLLSGGDREWGHRVAGAGYTLAYADDAVVRHPARTSWRELYRKRARVTEGHLDLLASDRFFGPPPFPQSLPGLLFPPVRPTVWALRDDEPGWPLLRRVRVAVAVWFVHYATTLTVIRARRRRSPSS